MNTDGLAWTQLQPEADMCVSTRFDPRPVSPLPHCTLLIQDAAQALLGGLAVSTVNNGNGHHQQQHKGVAGIEDGHQKVRGSGGGGDKQDEPNTPSSNRKGHDEEQTLLSGVGNLMKRARRGVNSYFSSLARQQKKFAREQRERHRRKSSNFDSLIGAEEGVGLLDIAAGAEDGDDENGTGTNGGPLHRSQSAIFVPSRPEIQQAEAPGSTVVSETRSTGMAADPRELRDVSEAAAFLQGAEGRYGGTGGRLGAGAGESSMKRGGRARLTTGDLVRLYREEEQGAGEDSAQDEDRTRSGAFKV